jgi:hypothetical protein
MPALRAMARARDGTDDIALETAARFCCPPSPFTR